MLGNPNAEPPWLEQCWRHVAEAVDPLIESSRGRAAVRSAQLSAEIRSPNSRPLSFGRIGWNAEGHKKWVWQAKDSGASRVFRYSEVWAPSWTTCEKEHRSPDVYFAFCNEGGLGRQQLSFNPVCILAVAADRGVEITQLGRKSAEGVAQILQALLRVHCERPWGYPVGQIAYTGAIGDMIAAGGLFKPGPRHRSPVSTAILEGTWNTF